MDSFSFHSPTIFSISALLRYLRELLETDEVLQDIWVRGEVSNFSQPRSGHLYFTLKDSEAQMRCVMWKNMALRLGFAPRDGMAVEAHGSMSVYEAGGTLQLYVDTLRPAGEGALYQEFLRLKARLEAEGLFDPDHKRPIPALPKVIGVVTSATGAALQDIRNTIARRLPLAKLVLAPTAVQGVEAPAGIVAAIQRLNQQVKPDLIIVGRGGGSIEDLWAFNDEQVARAIYASQAPVISGVGHETDFTIADFVADLRAPTPTAAAELATAYSISDMRLDLQATQTELADEMEAILGENTRALEQLSAQLRRYAPQTQIFNLRQRLDELVLRHERAPQVYLQAQKVMLSGLSSRLESLNPQAVLQRGYAIITRQADGRLVSRVGDVRTGEGVRLQVSDGSLAADITKNMTGE